MPRQKLGDKILNFLSQGRHLFQEHLSPIPEQRVGDKMLHFLPVQRVFCFDDFISFLSINVWQEFFILSHGRNLF